MSIVRFKQGLSREKHGFRNVQCHCEEAAWVFFARRRCSLIANMETAKNTLSDNGYAQLLLFCKTQRSISRI
jgi:hypothetical protein